MLMLYRSCFVKHATHSPFVGILGEIFIPQAPQNLLSFHRFMSFVTMSYACFKLMYSMLGMGSLKGLL